MCTLYTVQVVFFCVELENLKPRLSFLHLKKSNPISCCPQSSSSSIWNLNHQSPLLSLSRLEKKSWLKRERYFPFAEQKTSFYLFSLISNWYIALSDDEIVVGITSITLPRVPFFYSEATQADVDGDSPLEWCSLKLSKGWSNIGHIFYTDAFSGLTILHSEVLKHDKIASLKNSGKHHHRVDFYNGCKITHAICTICRR